MTTNNIQTRQTVGSRARTISAGLGIAALLSFSAPELSARSNGTPTNNSRPVAHAPQSSAGASTGNRHVNIAPSNMPSNRTPAMQTTHQQPTTAPANRQPLSTNRQQPTSSSVYRQPASVVNGRPQAGTQMQQQAATWSSNRQPVTGRQQPASSAVYRQPAPGLQSAVPQPGSRSTPFEPGRSFGGGSNTYVDHSRSDNRSYVDVRERRQFDHIPESHFRSSFGRGHEFRLGHLGIVGDHRGFQYGGVSFGLLQPWPARWQYSDAVFVDYVGGNYYLCNRMDPNVRVPVNVDGCDTCSDGADQPVETTLASCTQCTAQVNPDASSGVPTLSRGQSIDEVVSTMGSPSKIINLGIRQIYVFGDMRVTFLGGRLADVR